MRRASYRHAYLLAALLLTVFVRPLLGLDLQRGPFALIDVLFVAVLLAAVHACASRGRDFFVFLALAGLALATRAGWRAFGTEPWFVAKAAAGAGAILLAAILVLGQVFRDRRITADTIFASIAVYLLVGLLWAELFGLLLVFDPGAFELGQGDVGTREAKLVAFSFVTLTTLGYGNVVPVGARADALATLEAIVGQMYVAVVVARLVGIQVSQALAPAGRDGDHQE